VFLRALGGCLLAIGVPTLVLVHGPIRRGERWAMLALVMMVGVSEGINAPPDPQVQIPGDLPLLPWVAPRRRQVVPDHLQGTPE